LDRVAAKLATLDTFPKLIIHAIRRWEHRYRRESFRYQIWTIQLSALQNVIGAVIGCFAGGTLADWAAA